MKFSPIPSTDKNMQKRDSNDRREYPKKSMRIKKMLMKHSIEEVFFLFSQVKRAQTINSILKSIWKEEFTFWREVSGKREYGLVGLFYSLLHFVSFMLNLLL
jgi:hypothetical protein